MSMRNVVFLSTIVVVASTATTGCSAGGRATFRSSDPTFRPTRGPAPRVYLENDINDVDHGEMRSVGLIEVSFLHSTGVERAINAAIDKGRELGCWILIEHSAFEKRQSRAALDHGAHVILAHGPGHDVPTRSPARSRTMTFDCVIVTAAAPVATRSTPSSPHYAEAEGGVALRANPV